MDLETKLDNEKYTMGDGFKAGLCVGTDVLGTFYSANTDKPSVGTLMLKGKPIGQEVLHQNYSDNYESGKYLGMAVGVFANMLTGFTPQIVSAFADLGMYLTHKKE